MQVTPGEGWRSEDEDMWAPLSGSPGGGGGTCYDWRASRRKGCRTALSKLTVAAGTAPGQRPPAPAGGPGRYIGVNFPLAG